MSDIYLNLKKFGKVKLSEPLSKHTTFKIGGPATYFVVVSKIESAIELFKFLDEYGEQYILIGGGSNMLVSDNGYSGVVINIQDNTIKIIKNSVRSSAGASTVALAQETIKAGLTGFEWGVGVPGTIGGAVRGNAGATGAEIKDTLKSVDVYRDGSIITLSNEECQFGYRDSVFKHNNDIVLYATFNLENKDNKDVARKALEVLMYRNKTQPKGYASTGCIFKNPNKEQSAGKLIDEAGLKGKKIGNAQISEIHGNFIVNLGGATSSDVLLLIDEIKQKVYDTSGVNLEEEIKIIN